MNRDEFYTAFKHDIITSKLRPGELLKEKQIMQDYGIGRLPMREIMVAMRPARRLISNRRNNPIPLWRRRPCACTLIIPSLVQ